MNFPNRQLSLMYEVLLLGNVVMEVEERDDLYIAMGSARPATPSPPTPPSPPPYWRWTNMNHTGQVLTPSGLGGMSFHDNTFHLLQTLLERKICSIHSTFEDLTW